MNTEPVISIRDLRTQFGQSVIHDGVNLDIVRGEVMGIVGASDTGKSVLMRAVIGLVAPTAGSIHIFGQDKAAMSGAALNTAEKRYGVLFQNGAQFSSLTVAQNVIVPLKEHTGMSSTLMAEIAAYKIAMSGLPHDACAKYPAELSGGMRKRAGLARALALDPEILFLDETTAGLDPIGAAAFDELIRDLQQTLGLTVVMVTHDLDSLYALCDRVAVLVDKHGIAGTIQELAENLSKLTGTLAGSSGQIEQLIADSQKTFTALREAADGIAELMGGLNSKIGPISDGAQDVVVDVQKAVRGFSKVASQLELVVDENRDSIRDFSSGGLYELSQFIAEGRVLISALTRLSAQIERDPARFFFGDNQKGFEAK